MILLFLIIVIFIIYLINISKKKSYFSSCEIYYNKDAQCPGCISNTLDCLPGYYKNNDTCIPCPIGSYCNSNVKYDCDTNYISNDKSIIASDCFCKEGYYKQSGNCIECPAGYYCPVGTSAPIICGALKTSLPGSSNIENCTCPNGYYKNYFDNKCMPCNFDGIYCSGTSTKQLCPEGYYCINGIRYQCPTGTTSFPGSLDVSQCFYNCGIGKYVLNNECTDCPIDNYCPDGLTIVKCPGTTTTNNEINKTKLSDCICPSGFFINPTTQQCETVNSVINSYTSDKRIYTLMKDIYKTVSPMSINGEPEFNYLRLMASNKPAPVPIGLTESSFIPMNNNIKGFYCRLIRIHSNPNNTIKSVTIKRLILLDTNENIINSKFRLTVVSGSYITQGNYDDRFQNINDINLIIEPGIYISLLSVDEIDVKVYKIIISLGNGNYNTLTTGNMGLYVYVTNNTMYNNLNLTSSLPNPLENLTSVPNSNGLEFDVKLLSNRELYNNADIDMKKNINDFINSLPSNKAKFLSLNKLTSLNSFGKVLTGIKMPISIPIVYPTDFDQKTIVFKGDIYNSIPLNSIFIIHLQDEFYYKLTDPNIQTDLKLFPEYPPGWALM